MPYHQYHFTISQRWLSWLWPVVVFGTIASWRSARAHGLDDPTGIAPGAQPIKSRAQIDSKSPLPSDEVLAPFRVSAPPYEAQSSPMEKSKVRRFFGLGRFPFGWPGISGRFLITPNRSPEPWRVNGDYSVVFDDLDPLAPPPDLIDTLLLPVSELRELVRFYRGMDYIDESLTRFTGLPASNSEPLLLLNGSPLNSAFGGKVIWAEVPRLSLIRAEFIPRGGASAQGNATTDGVAQFFSQSPSGKLIKLNRKLSEEDKGYSVQKKETVVGSGMVEVSLADFGTQSLAFLDNEPIAQGVLQFEGQVEHARGTVSLSSVQKGIVDNSLETTQGLFSAKWRQLLHDKVDVTVAFRGYTDTTKGGVGTDWSRRENDSLAVTFSSSPSAYFAWNASVAFDDSSAGQVYSIANTPRTIAYRVFELYARPTDRFYANWTGRWSFNDRNQLVIGADGKLIHGEIRERILDVNEIFTRDRRAGGTQQIVGAFAIYDRAILSSLHIKSGVRLDSVEDRQGHVQLTDLSSGQAVDNSTFAARRHALFTPTLELAWRPGTRLKVSANAQIAYRQPTLQEMNAITGRYAIVTLPNENLGISRTSSAELAVEYSPTLTLTFVGAVFARRLDHLAIERAFNKTSDVLDGSIAGFADVALREMSQLERAHEQGIDFSVKWRPLPPLFVQTTLLAESTVIDRDNAPASLVGKQLASSPRYRANLSLHWLPVSSFDVRYALRWESSRFDDVENTRLLHASVTADIGVTYILTLKTELFLSIRNLFVDRSDKSLTPSGIVYLSAPRQVEVGTRFRW